MKKLLVMLAAMLVGSGALFALTPVPEVEAPTAEVEASNEGPKQFTTEEILNKAKGIWKDTGIFLQMLKSYR